MLQKVLQTILRRYFGQFITGLENAQLAFWTGKINIQNASFRHQRINELLKVKNIPLSVKFSFIGSLELDIPWNKLSSAPVQIKISNVYIVFTLQKIQEHMHSQQKLEENAKLILIKNYVDYILKKSEELKAEGQNEAGFLKKLMVKVLHNVNIQINNIHIRIQSTSPKDSVYEAEPQEEVFYSCLAQNDKPIGFSLGFCIENIEAQTIDSNNEKQYVQIENDKTAIRKTINLRQISFYWEEEEYANMLTYTNERKIQLLKGIIGRSQHRLLTIDGNLLMEKNKEQYNYFFSTSFRVLQIKTNYLQLKQIIQVVQQFANAKTKKKIIKMKQSKHQLQLKLQNKYRQIFKELYANKFEKINLDTIKLLESVDRKLLMKWTKDECIEVLKKQKLKHAVESKNKRKWLGFLSKNSQLQLTQEEIKLIQSQITKFIQSVDDKDSKISIGLHILIKSINVLMEHHSFNQKLFFIADQIQLNFQQIRQNLKLRLNLLDISLTYQDLQKKSGVAIFKKNARNDSIFLHFELQNNRNQQKLDFQIQQFCITHQIQFLGFISEMINLQEREQGKAKMMLLKADAINKKNQQLDPSTKTQKIYDYKVRLKKMEIKVQLDSQTQLYSYIEGISIAKDTKSSKTHAANLTNFGLTYINTKIPQKSYTIIQDVNIIISLVGLKQLRSTVPKIKVVLNQECLYSIGNCLKSQYKLLKMRKMQYKKQILEQQQKYMQGQTQIISVFKSLKIYHTVLTSDKLLFYQKQPGKSQIDFSRAAKTVPLNNTSISRRDDFSFKLQSVLTNQIVSCKSKQDTDQWLYLIQQRIYESSSRQQIFSMADADNQHSNLQPHIYIPYDSTIDITVQMLEVIYQKNSQEKILSTYLRNLCLILKENNLQFQRKVLLHQICIKNLAIVDQQRDQYNTILSNLINCFEDPDSDSSINDKPNYISVLIEGKKKTHPQYTGQICIKSSINRLFINYNAQFIFDILYRLTYGDQKAKTFPQSIRNLKVIQMLKQVLQNSKGIPQKYQNANLFEFSRNYVQLQKYKQAYSCNVLFHVEFACEQIELYVVNGKRNIWMDKVLVDRVSLQIDKSTEFIFLKGKARDLTISDLTGYPNTNKTPFSQAEPYPIILSQTNRKEQYMVQFSAGLFEPLVFINQQRFKNYFELTINDLMINYQQQPVMRFIDALTNQLILFFLQPFSLHKYDSPYRGPYSYGNVNFTEKQIMKILTEAIYPFYTNLRIHVNRLALNFNSHPHQQFIRMHIGNVKLISNPYINNQRVEIQSDILKQLESQYKTLQELQKEECFVGLVSKFQWATRYLINADDCRCDIFQNNFNYEMYFERANNGDKDILLPFLKINKDMVMEGRIKNLNVTASKKVYNLINRCFNYNLSYDDGCESHYLTNHQHQHLQSKSKLIFRIVINQLSYLIPELNRTVIVIPNCQYKFQREEDNAKTMKLLGRSLHIFDNRQKNNLIKPVKFDQPIGLMFGIGMKTSGEKRIYASLKYIEFTYHQTSLTPLLQYFLLDDSCYPKQDHYPAIPEIRCEADILNSYIRIAEFQDYIYALKGNIRVIWIRNSNTHPQVYKQNKDMYPNNSDASSYEIQLKGVNLCKYSRKQFEKKSNHFRPLSSLMTCKFTLVNKMKKNNDVFYTDMRGQYDIQNVELKLCYKDILQIQQSFKKPQDSIQKQQQIRKSRRNSAIQPQLGYTPHSIHNLEIKKFSLQLGLSQLPVPLLDVTLHNSSSKIQLIGTTKIFTNKLELTLQYWNMLIGRWQLLLEKAAFDVTLRFSKENYYSVSSTKLLLNLSIESLKVLRLISSDFAQKGNFRILKQEGRIRDIQVSPYAITNRTGHNIFMQNLAIETAVNNNKLKNNDTMHIRSNNTEDNDNFEKIKFQIQGDNSKEYELNLNIVQPVKATIQFNKSEYFLIYQSFSSPILKEIIISSQYIIHNQTSYRLILSVGQHQFTADPDKKVAIPFTHDLQTDKKKFKLTFPHLTDVKQNYTFSFQDIKGGHQYYTVYGDDQMFYCFVELQINLASTINISPLTTLLNLIPLPIKMEISLTKTTGSKLMITEVLQVNKEKIFYQFGTIDTVSARVKIQAFSISSFQNMGLTKIRAGANRPIQNQGLIILSDHRGLESYIMTKTKRNKNKNKKSIYIYTECVLINQTQYKIYLFSGTSLISGQHLDNIPESQSKYIFINQTQNLSIGFRQDDPSLTSKLSLQQLGNQYLKVTHDERLYELVVHSSVHCVNQQMQLFTRILKLTPRYILINECTRDICFRQNNTYQKRYLKIKQRLDWYWQSNDQLKQITMTALDNQFQLVEGWGFSSPFQLQNLEENVIVLRPKLKSPHRLLIKIQIVKQIQYTYIIFKQLKNVQESLVTFKNCIRLVRLEISQHKIADTNPSWSDFKHFECPPGQETIFGWDYPIQKQIINVYFNFLGSYRTKYYNETIPIDLDRLKKPMVIQFVGDQGNQNGVLEIQVSLQIVGIRKKITFQSKDQSQISRLRDQQLSQISGSKMGLSLSEIGISIIGGRKPRCEIIFISIKKLQLIMMQKQYKRNYELKIKYINIDNNLNHNTIYPVLFTPLKQRKTIEKARPFFICLVQQNLKSKQTMELNFFRMAMEPISFKLYDQIITKLYDMQKQFNTLGEKQKKVQLCDIYRSYEKTLQWQNRQPSKRDRSIFIRQVQIGKIIIELSFSIKPSSGGNIIIYTIVTLFKTVLSNVSQSQIKLSRFNRKNINMGDLTNQLSQFYRKQIFKQIYKIPGSINILGNPYVFVKYMGEGVWEIINQPSEGFIKGPIEGAFGVVKGVVYFARNVIAGSFNSFEVISQSCSQGISYVTFDQKFITRREKIQMQKSKHIGQGTKSAIFAVYTGIEVAVTGLYRLPKQNFEKSGTPGLFKGILIGLTGLFTKPLSGLFQGISKFSQGVKQTALFFQDGPNTTRSRPPRVFLGYQQYYTQYNAEESKAINLLQFHSTKHLNKRVMVVSADQSPQENDIIYTVLTNEYLVLLSKSKKKIIREIKVEQINQVDPRTKGNINELVIKYAQDQILIVNSHKCKEMFECFRILFYSQKKDDDPDEVDSQ